MKCAFFCALREELCDAARESVQYKFTNSGLNFAFPVVE